MAETTSAVGAAERRAPRPRAGRPKVLIAIAVAVPVLVLSGIGAVIAFGCGGDSRPVSDNFDRRTGSNTLGKAPHGAQWETLSGTWGTRDSFAYLANQTPGTNLAVVDPQSADGRVSAVLSPAVSGAGIAFRVVDVRNYWAVVASPGFGTWNVVKVVDGFTTFVANTNLTPTSGRRIVSVGLNGDVIQIFIDAKALRTVSAPEFSDATRAGMVAVPGAITGAHWTEFSASG